MTMYDIIYKKRGGAALTDEEIAWFVRGYTAGDIPDCQAAALCMAIYYQGMTDRETVALTAAMETSGDTVDLSPLGDKTVDKHSTGGVGDKTSLIVAPIVAALGCKVAKMSGRGLGHTGGTVDKLAAIPGFRTTLSADAFMRQVDTVGVAVIGQTGNLAPADKKLYALRDITATVDSIPLITSSIMSKKLAAGSQNIVLDVKVGSGAFMKTKEHAAALAHGMVSIGTARGRRVSALLTNMDIPLGHAVGNALEVKEAIAVLKNEVGGDLREVCVALATEMVSLARGISPDDAAMLVEETLTAGAALAKMREWVKAQGGDVHVIDNPAGFPRAAYSRDVKADVSGYITAMNAEKIGLCAMHLGAGRANAEDTIDPAAGVYLHKKTGDYVEVGDTLCTLYTERRDTLDAVAAEYLSAIAFDDTQPSETPVILDIIKETN